MKWLITIILSLVSLLQAREIRVATYNVALSQDSQGRLSALLRPGTFLPAKRVAEVVQIIQPDVLLLNEFDYDAGGTAATRMNDKYFKVSQNGRDPQDYPFRYVGVSNTGLHSGFDLDNSGGIDNTPGDQSYGGDAFGFGEFPGKFAMAVFSKFPIDFSAIRTFEEILWKDLPGNLIPPGFYSPEELEVLRISSKNHWDIPIVVDGRTFHFLVSHPTPPVFDGPENRNGRRNHDEIRIWADYLMEDTAGYLGRGLSPNAPFIIAGDQNADPTRGDSVNAAINQLLDHPRVNGSFIPERTGASSNTTRFNTATFNLRVDYVLPSKAGFQVTGGAVFWPTGTDDGANLIGVSDHRPVYLDLVFEPMIDQLVRDLTISRTGNEVTLTWLGDPAASYGIEVSSNLKIESWQSVTNPMIEFTNERASFHLTIGENVQFLRVSVGPSQDF